MATQKDARQNYHLQFASAPTSDTPGTLAVLHFDNKRYMFGRMAEGTQRACVQRGIGVKKVRNIFLTGTNTWKDNGGLIGFMLTLADQQLQETEADGSGGRPRLNIHGGPKLLHSVACARRFVFRTGVPLAIHESTGKEFQWPSEPSFVDENIRVWPVAIAGEQSLPSTENNFTTSPDQLQAEQSARQKIVSDMFDSEWRRDRLVETPFSQVNMPATVWLRDPETKELKGLYCTSMDDATEIKADQIVLVRNPWPASLVGQLPNASNLPSGVAMSYIVRGHHQRGAFDKNKAKELGVPNGPVRKSLTDGDSITLEDGRIITPNMVLGEGKEGKGIVFFDLPTVTHLDHLQALISANSGLLNNIAVAVWTLGHDVASASRFTDTIKTLDMLEHFVSDSDTAPDTLAFESVAGSSTRLSDVSSALFPVPKYNNTAPFGKPATKHKLEDPSRLSLGKDALPSIVPFQAGFKINIEPKYGRDATEVPEPMTVDLAHKASSVEYTAAKEALASVSMPVSDFLNEPEILTLGTGSALPSKYRNVSATLLRMPNGQGNYLLDCGENTMGQLRRMFTAPELDDILMNLKAIWISHLHADHHLGTITVLQERATVFETHAPQAERTIYLMSEQNKLDFIRDYSSVEPSLVQDTGMVPLLCDEDLGPTLNGETFEFPADNAIAKVRTVRVSHCWGAQAISITFKDGFKISYSGDCRPSGKFCAIGYRSDVLIHEATFDDGMEGDARAKKHSTTSEALGVALRMRAKNVVLTHFSQRYQKVPNLENVKLPGDIQYEEGSAAEEAGPVDEGAVDEDAVDNGAVQQQAIVSDETMDRQSAMSLGADLLESVATASSTSPSSARRDTSRQRRQSSAAKDMAVCVAFDYMRVRVSQIKECKKFYPAIQAMFNEMEQRSENKRAVERERMEAQASAKKQKKGKWQAEQGSGKQKKAKTDANETNGPLNPPIDAGSMNEHKSEDVGRGPVAIYIAGAKLTNTFETRHVDFNQATGLLTSTKAEEWWDQVATKSNLNAEDWWHKLPDHTNSDNERVGAGQYSASAAHTAEESEALALPGHTALEKSKKQLKREAAKKRKEDRKRTKLGEARQDSISVSPGHASRLAEGYGSKGAVFSLEDKKQENNSPSRICDCLRRLRGEIRLDHQQNEELMDAFLDVMFYSESTVYPDDGKTSQTMRRVIQEREEKRRSGERMRPSGEERSLVAKLLSGLTRGQNGTDVVFVAKALRRLRRNVQQEQVHQDLAKAFALAIDHSLALLPEDQNDGKTARKRLRIFHDREIKAASGSLGAESHEARQPDEVLTPGLNTTPAIAAYPERSVLTGPGHDKMLGASQEAKVSSSESTKTMAPGIEPTQIQKTLRLLSNDIRQEQQHLNPDLAEAFQEAIDRSMALLPGTSWEIMTRGEKQQQGRKDCRSMRSEMKASPQVDVTQKVVKPTTSYSKHSLPAARHSTAERPPKKVRKTVTDKSPQSSAATRRVRQRLQHVVEMPLSGHWDAVPPLLELGAPAQSPPFTPLLPPSPARPPSQVKPSIILEPDTPNKGSVPQLQTDTRRNVDAEFKKAAGAKSRSRATIKQRRQRGPTSDTGEKSSNGKNAERRISRDSRVSQQAPE